MEKHLPYNLEAERGVLGSLIIDPEAIEQVADFLSAEDFYRDAHKTLYSAITRLHASHISADFITLTDALESSNMLDAVGGASSISSLIDEIPTSGNIAHYGHIVERTALQRRLIHAASRIAQLAYDDTEQPLLEAQRLLATLDRPTGGSGAFLGMTEVMSNYMAQLEHLHQHRHELPGVSTGYDEIDALTGGLQKTDLILLAGRPGSGKTSLAINIAYNAAGNGRRVAVFSLEMGHRQLANRLMSMETGIDSQRLRHGWIGDDEWENIVAALGRLSNLGIAINDASGSPIASMRSQLRRVQSTGGPIDLVVVDYLQLIDGDESDRRENREKEISAISRGLKALAKEFDVPVLALAQLSRKVEERQSKRPVLSDLRDSGALEQDADIVAFIYRDDYYAKQEGRPSNRPGIADVIVAKHRNGDVGEIALEFHAAQTQFVSMAKSEGK